MRLDLWRAFLRPWLQVRFDCDLTAVLLPFDCNSTALLPFEEAEFIKPHHSITDHHHHLFAENTIKVDSGYVNEQDRKAHCALTSAHNIIMGRC